MAHLSDLSKEIEEMEAAFNNPTEKVAIVEDETVDEKVGEPTEVVDNDETKSEKDPAPKKPKKRNDWKKRYVNYKASTDATVFALRKDLATALGQVENMQDQITVMQKAAPKQEPDFKSKFSDTDREVLGDEALDSMNKAVQDAIAPLKKELANARKEKSELIKDQREKASVDAATIFLKRLANIVPEYDEINLDPAFAKWLNEVDSASGFTKLSLFKTAERSGDVGRVATFMKDFIAKRDGKNIALEAKLNPETTSSPAAVPKQKEDKLSQQEIDKFYRDVTKGYYRGRESERVEMEKKIDSYFSKIMVGG